MEAKEYFNIGYEKQQKERFKEAIEDYNKVLELDKDFERAIVQKAYCKFQLEDYEGALIDFKLAMRLNPNDSITFLNAGYTAYKLNIDTDTISFLNKAIELDSNMAEAYFLRGTFYCNKKYYHQAIKNFTKAIDLNFSVVGSYSMRASCYSKLENYFENAIADYKLLIKLDPQKESYYYHLAYIYFSMGKYANALSYCNMAINLSKDCSTNYFLRGLTYQTLERYNEALLDFKKSKEIDPTYDIDTDILDCKRKLTLKLIKT